MSDDWKVGDLALCVNDDPCPVYPGTEGGIRKGDRYVVIQVRFWRDVWRQPQTALVLDRCNPVHPISGKRGGHNAFRFKRITPHTPDAEDAEVIALLNGAGVKEASDA